MPTALEILNGISEDTTTGDIAPVMVGVPWVIRNQRTKKKLTDEEEKKKAEAAKVKESKDDDEKPVIPKEAENLDKDSSADDKDEKPAIGATIEPLISPVVALVAPDVTPDGEKPLDPSQVPVTMPQQPADTEQSVLRTLIGQHQKNFKPAQGPVTNKQGSPEDKMQHTALPTESLTMMADVKAKIVADKILQEAMDGKQRDITVVNPNSAGKAMAAMRMILGQ